MRLWQTGFIKKKITCSSVTVGFWSIRFLGPNGSVLFWFLLFFLQRISVFQKKWLFKKHSRLKRRHLFLSDVFNDHFFTLWNASPFVSHVELLCIKWSLSVRCSCSFTLVSWSFIRFTTSEPWHLHSGRIRVSFQGSTAVFAEGRRTFPQCSSSTM